MGYPVPINGFIQPSPELEKHRHQTTHGQMVRRSWQEGDCCISHMLNRYPRAPCRDNTQTNNAVQPVVHINVKPELSQSSTAPCVSTLCLPDITTHRQISQAFPLCICMLQAIKDWRQRLPGNDVRQSTQCIGLPQHVAMVCLVLRLKIDLVSIKSANVVQFQF